MQLVERYGVPHLSSQSGLAVRFLSKSFLVFGALNQIFAQIWDLQERKISLDANIFSPSNGTRIKILLVKDQWDWFALRFWRKYLSDVCNVSEVWAMLALGRLGNARQPITPPYDKHDLSFFSLTIITISSTFGVPSLPWQPKHLKGRWGNVSVHPWVSNTF